MPWSPIPKFPLITKELKATNPSGTVRIEALRKAVMRHTGIIKDETIKKTVQAMESLGWLIRNEDGSSWQIPDKEETELSAADMSEKIESLQQTIDDLNGKIEIKDERINRLIAELSHTRKLYVKASDELEKLKGGEKPEQDDDAVVDEVKEELLVDGK